MQILKSELTQRFYAVGDNYKPGGKKQDVTEYMEQVIAGERERIIDLLMRHQNCLWVCQLHRDGEGGETFGAVPETMLRTVIEP